MIATRLDTRPCTPEELFRVPHHEVKIDSPAFPKTMTYDGPVPATVHRNNERWVWIGLGILVIGGMTYFFIEQQKARKKKKLS